MQIDYEKEVKAVYPDAVIGKYNEDWIIVHSRLAFQDRSFIWGGHPNRKKKAWQSAYNSLVKQGKIQHQTTD